MNYSEMQRLWLVEDKVMYGTVVKVKYRCISFSMGWNKEWKKEMDEFIGKKCKVIATHPINGIGLRLLSGSIFITYYFPYFVLEVSK